MKRRIFKFITGLFKFTKMILLLFFSCPYWICLLCYDLGDPKDDKNRADTFLDKILE